MNQNLFMFLKHYVLLRNQNAQQDAKHHCSLTIDAQALSHWKQLHEDSGIQVFCSKQRAPVWSQSYI